MEAKRSILSDHIEAINEKICDYSKEWVSRASLPRAVEWGWGRILQRVSDGSTDLN
jgi:hypothetical protein